MRGKIECYPTPADGVKHRMCRKVLYLFLLEKLLNQLGGIRVEQGDRCSQNLPYQIRILSGQIFIQAEPRRGKRGLLPLTPDPCRLTSDV
jgi:hypothetical protein